MAKFHKNLHYHPDTTPKHNITDDELKFLQELQKELNTQDHVSQADPRFWVIMGQEKQVVPDGYEDNVVLYDNDAAEELAEGIDNIIKFLNEKFKDHDEPWTLTREYDSYTVKSDEKHLYCKPIKGMLTTTHYNAESERHHISSYKLNYPEYFVPFRKNAKDLTLENLAWSKAVCLESRCYADTEDEAIEQYNTLILTSIKELLPIIMKDANEVILNRLTDDQIKTINEIKSVTI